MAVLIINVIILANVNPSICRSEHYIIFCITFSVLPQLTRFPRASSIQTTTVIIEWDAWDSNAGDIGDGPVILYNVYDAQTFMLATTVAASSSQSVYAAVIESLTPGTTYNFYITAVREGTGGEGPPSQRFVTFTTLSTQPQPTTQPPAPTTTMVIPTTKTTTNAQMQTSRMLTTMQGRDTEPPVVDRTSPADGIRTSPSGNTAIRDRTSLGRCYECSICRPPKPQNVVVSLA